MPSPINTAHATKSPTLDVVIEDRIATSYPHRKQLKYAEFEEKILNQKLTISNIFRQATLQFNVRELLDHLGVHSAFLKGSTAWRWPEQHLAGDIDLQFFPPEGSQLNTPEHMVQKLDEFLLRKASESSPTVLVGKTSHWMKTIDQKSGDTWQRTLMRLGCPGHGLQNVDIHCSNRTNGGNYDTLNASTVMYFNTAKNQLARLNLWSKDLIAFFEQHKLTWFNPDIESGLIRLSYRASKSPPLTLVQPGLFRHFLDQAKPEELAQVYCRGLTQTEELLNTSHPAVALLWVPVVEKLLIGEKENNPKARELLAHVLNWSGKTPKDLLLATLQNSPTQELARTLSQCFRVVAGMSNQLLDFLNKEVDCKTHLRQHGTEAFQIRLESAAELFKKIHNSKLFHHAPELELHAVFEEFLNVTMSTAEDTQAKLARSMLSYLKGEPAGKLEFAIQSIPRNALSCPSKETQERVFSAFELFFTHHSFAEAAPQLKLISDVGLRSDLVHQLPHIVLKNINETDPLLWPGLFKTPLMMALYIGKLQQPALHALIQSTQTRKPIWTSRTLRQTQQLLDSLDRLDKLISEQGTPPLLKQVITRRGDKLMWIQPSGEWCYIPKDRTLHLHVDGENWVLDPTLKLSNTPVPSQATEWIEKIFWPDNTVFQGLSRSDSEFTKGTMMNINLNTCTDIPTPLQKPLDVAKSHWGIDLGKHHELRIQGAFRRQALESAEAVNQAILAFHEGLVHQRFPVAHIDFEYLFAGGKPTRGNAHASQSSDRPGLVFNFVATPPENATETRAHPWADQAWDKRVRMRYLTRNDPYPDSEIEINLPWNENLKKPSGFASIVGQGAESFMWQGMIQPDAIKNNQINPVGAFYTGSLQAESVDPEPTVRFETDGPSSNLPIAFLPLMAEFLGPKLRGNYRFAGSIWNGEGDWPVGRECFVWAQTQTNKFSGYLFADGKALGCMKIHEPPAGMPAKTMQSHVGNFIHVPLEQAAGKPHITTSSIEALVPHGLCEVNLHLAGSHWTHRSLFFLGQEWRFQNMTQDNSKRYNSPLETQYYMGLRYEQSSDKTLENIHFVFNPDDQGPDFRVSTPSNPEAQKSRHYKLADAKGFEMNLIQTHDDEIKMGTLMFPNGLRYTGPLKTQDGRLMPHGRGGYVWRDRQIMLESNQGGQVQRIHKMNASALALLNGVNMAKPAHTLPTLLGMLTEGELDWNRDCAAHLHVRQFDHLKPKAVVFSQN